MAALPLIHMTEKNLVVSVTKIWSSSFDSHNIEVKVQKIPAHSNIHLVYIRKMATGACSNSAYNAVLLFWTEMFS